MSTTIHMRCGGCDAEKEVPICRTLQSFSGRGYGFGAYHTPTLDKVTEVTGWVWADPYTGCTYCPECWKEIDSGKAA